MTSKEKLALIKETWYDVDLTDEKYIDFDEEQTFSDLEKDLEDYEELKKIMGTPIQDIMKRLKILELIKKCYYSASFSNTLFKTSYGFDNPQDIEKIGEYLDGKD